MNPSPLAQVAETVRPSLVSLAVEARARGGTARLTAQSFWDADGRRGLGAEDGERAARNELGIAVQRPSAPVGGQHNDGLSAEVRHLVQIMQANRRPERIEVTAGPVGAGPSRIIHDGEDDNSEEPMVIG